MNKLTKKQMLYKIRKLLGFPNSNRDFFNNEEMLGIVKKINPTWERKPKMQKGKQVTKRCFGKIHKVWLTENSNILPEGVPNWTQQRVVGTHPNLANLKNILSQLEKINSTKLTPLMKDIKAASLIITKPEQLVSSDCDGDPDLHNLAIARLSMDPGQDIDICYDCA